MVAMPLQQLIPNLYPTYTQVIPKLYPSYTQVIPSTNGSNAITATYTRALAKVNMVTSSHMVSSFGMVALLPFVLGCYTLFLISPRAKEDKNNSSSLEEESLLSSFDRRVCILCCYHLCWVVTLSLMLHSFPNCPPRAKEDNNDSSSRRRNVIIFL